VLRIDPGKLVSPFFAVLLFVIVRGHPPHQHFCLGVTAGVKDGTGRGIREIYGPQSLYQSLTEQV